MSSIEKDIIEIILSEARNLKMVKFLEPFDKNPVNNLHMLLNTNSRRITNCSNFYQKTLISLGTYNEEGDFILLNTLVVNSLNALFNPVTVKQTIRAALLSYKEQYSERDLKNKLDFFQHLTETDKELLRNFNKVTLSITKKEPYYRIHSIY